jgi:hypothetical protein
LKADHLDICRFERGDYECMEVIRNIERLVEKVIKVWNIEPAVESARFGKARRNAPTLRRFVEERLKENIVGEG